MNPALPGALAGALTPGSCRTLITTTLKQCFAAKHSLEADDRAKDATPDEEASGIARDAQRNKATQKRESGGQYRARKWTISGCRNC